MASQITSISSVCSSLHKKHQSSASLVFGRGIPLQPVRSPHTKGHYRGKCSHLMTSPCQAGRYRFKVFLSHRNLADISIAVLSRCLSNICDMIILTHNSRALRLCKRSEVGMKLSSASCRCDSIRRARRELVHKLGPSRPTCGPWAADMATLRWLGKLVVLRYGTV